MSGYGQNQVRPTGYGYNIPQQAMPQAQPTQQTQPTGGTFQNPFTGGGGRGLGGRIMGYGMNFAGGGQRRFQLPETMQYQPDKFQAMGPYNMLARDMSMGRMGMPSFGAQGFGYSPYGYGGGPTFGAWPGFGIGGMPGRYQAQSMYGPGQSFGMPGGYFGGSRFGYSGMDNPYGPGSYSSPGAMPYGQGAGQVSRGRGSPFTTFPGIGGGGMWGQTPRQIQPAQQIAPWLAMRSPFSRM